MPVILTCRTCGHEKKSHKAQRLGGGAYSVPADESICEKCKGWMKPTGWED